MGLFDSNSSNTTQNTTNNLSSGADNGGLSANNSEITITDGGAMSQAFQLANQAITTSAANQNSLASKFSSFSGEVAKGDSARMTELMKWGIGGAVLYFSFKALKGKN